MAPGILEWVVTLYSVYGLIVATKKAYTVVKKTSQIMWYVNNARYVYRMLIPTTREEMYPDIQDDDGDDEILARSFVIEKVREPVPITRKSVPSEPTDSFVSAVQSVVLDPVLLENPLRPTKYEFENPVEYVGPSLLNSTTTPRPPRPNKYTFENPPFA